MICYCCCRQSSQKPSIELQKSFKPYLEAVKFNPNSSQAHANASSLDALDVATLNPRYVVFSFSTSPPIQPTPPFLHSVSTQSLTPSQTIRRAPQHQGCRPYPSSNLDGTMELWQHRPHPFRAGSQQLLVQSLPHVRLLHPHSWWHKHPLSPPSR
jgi:hypothetical protein